MARILPETPPTTAPAEVLRAFRALKALPETYTVWHHLAPWQPNAPDFLLLDEAGRVLLIKISSATAAQATPAAQFLLMEDERPPLGGPESQCLQAFIASIGLPEEQQPGALILFPNIPHTLLLESRHANAGGQPTWAGRELLQSETALDWPSFLPSRPLAAFDLEKLRQRFTPEVVVPASMTVCPRLERRLEAGLTNYLLDYDQEAAVKADLDPGLDGQMLSNDFRLNIINGVAGSGKTLILLYRLRLLYHLYPAHRFLILTHNRPLIRDIEGRFHRLEGKSPENIEWRTFHGWCRQRWPENAPWINPLSERKRQAIAEAIWGQNLRQTSLTPQMFLSEVDWLKDQPPLNLEDYLAADRRGRGFGLAGEQRQRVYAAFEAYQKALDAQQATDWSDIPRRLWAQHEAGELEWPQYDTVLVDEAQFFAPLWMAIIRQLVKPTTGHLFIVADPTQGFLGRGGSWKSLGLDARGRSHQLQRSYRTTRAILQFATQLYHLRLVDEEDEDILVPDLAAMPAGPPPQIITLTSPQDEITRVANEVADFVRQAAVPRSHLLVLHANASGVHSLIQAINERLGKDAALDPKDSYPGNYVRVTTLNAGAGLESPIVFLAGVRELLEAEASLRITDEERATLIRDNTRKLYMAATRAGQRLIFTYVGEMPDLLRRAFE